MAKPIVYVDQSEIRSGKFEELKTVINDLVAFIEANEPQLIAHNVYFSEDRRRMTVIHVHRDTASLDYYMKVAGHKFPEFAKFIQLESIDIYGNPGDDLVERLRGKAEMLGRGTVRIHKHHAGLNRFLVG